MRSDPSSITALRAGLEALADAVGGVSFATSGDAAERGTTERDDLIRTIREYLLPRLRDPDAPVVAAIVGPSGTGKSAVLNAIAGETVSRVGALRPTTTAPVMWAHREHAGRAWSDFVARVRERVGPALEVVVGDSELTRDLTIIDTPPFDLAAAAGPAAYQILSMVDLCVFVTSGLRYADAASWEFLEDVKGRGVPMVFVFNRLGEAERDDLLGDFATRLARAALLVEADPSLVFAVPETVLSPSERLPADLVATLRTELGELSDPASRHALVYQTAEGAARSVARRALALEQLATDERSAAKRLGAIVDLSYGRQADRLSREVRSGSLAWLIDHDHWPSVAVDLTGILTRRAGVAAQEAAADWAMDDVGAAFLHRGGQGLWRHSHDTTYESQRLLEQWAEGLEDVAAAHAKRRRLGRHRRRNAATFLWKAALVPGHEARGGIERAFGPGLQAARDAAVTGLCDTLDRALRTDAARFLAYLGPAGDPRRLQRVVEEAGAVFAALDGPSRPPTQEDAPAVAAGDLAVTTSFEPAPGMDGDEEAVRG